MALRRGGDKEDSNGRLLDKTRCGSNAESLGQNGTEAETRVSKEEGRNDGDDAEEPTVTCLQQRCDTAAIGGVCVRMATALLKMTALSPSTDLVQPPHAQIYPLYSGFPPCSASTHSDLSPSGSLAAGLP